MNMAIKFTNDVTDNFNKRCLKGGGFKGFYFCPPFFPFFFFPFLKSCSIRIIAPPLFGKDNFTCNTNNLSREKAGWVNGMHFTAHLGFARNRKQMVLAAGFPLGPAQCQPVVVGWLLLALCDLNIVGQWQKKSNLFHWAANCNEIWQIWHSIPNI